MSIIAEINLLIVVTCEAVFWQQTISFLSESKFKSRWILEPTQYSKFIFLTEILDSLWYATSRTVLLENAISVRSRFSHSWKHISGQYDFGISTVHYSFYGNKTFCPQKYLFGWMLDWLRGSPLLCLMNFNLYPWTTNCVSSGTFSQSF